MGKFSGTGFNYNEESNQSNRTVEDLLRSTYNESGPVVSALDNLSIDRVSAPAPEASTPEPISTVMGQDEEGSSFEMAADKTEEQEAQAVLDQQSWKDLTLCIRVLI